MKRLFPWVLMLFFLFSGCGKEIAETIPIETTQAHSCIEIRAAEGPEDFGSFHAQAPGAEEERAARALVESVLAQYPAGFAEQWGDVRILLVAQLTGEDRYAGPDYAGFTQRTDDGWLLVLDASRCDAGTVHHELAHILDGILTEAGALTESEWMGFCPDGFRYGEGSWEQYPDFFADAYAMTDIREDRARTFEDAVLGGPGIYADRPALWLKLDCFSRAIRAHFDTTGWPAKTIWELALG